MASATECMISKASEVNWKREKTCQRNRSLLARTYKDTATQSCSFEVADLCLARLEDRDASLSASRLQRLEQLSSSRRRLRKVRCQLASQIIMLCVGSPVARVELGDHQQAQLTPWHNSCGDLSFHQPTCRCNRALVQRPACVSPAINSSQDKPRACPEPSNRPRFV
jgi:hypothetical protein